MQRHLPKTQGLKPKTQRRDFREGGNEVLRLPLLTLTGSVSKSSGHLLSDWKKSQQTEKKLRF